MTSQLVSLRHALHDLAEASGEERRTATFLQEFFQTHPPTKLDTSLPGYGLAALFESTRPGPTLLLRADLDAIRDDPTSTQPHAAHRCGHDGHMTMLLGLVLDLERRPLNQGRVALVFQPAEETGEGALPLVESEFFQNLNPDVVLGLHNIPGQPLGRVLLREGSFAWASVGMRAHLRGRSAHAGEAEKGQSPKEALAYLLTHLPLCARENHAERCTVTHARLGEPTFGVSPGDAVLHVTLRAEQDEDLAALCRRVHEMIQTQAANHALAITLEPHEPFPATRNAPRIVQRAVSILQARHHDLTMLEHPFFWSEDFGHFTARKPGMLFGLGSGETQPSLHNPDFDFPDALLEQGVAVWRSLVDGFLEDSSLQASKRGSTSTSVEEIVCSNEGASCSRP